MHCIDEDFGYAECCSGADPSACMEKFRYCTQGVEQNVYRELTCMQVSCPKGNKPAIHRHDDYALIESEIMDWGIMSNAYQCRVVISASERLNGKLIVEIYSVNDASIRVYQMPNSFNREIYGTKGILENNRINITDEPAIFKVPTDWTVIL